MFMRKIDARGEGVAVDFLGRGGKKVPKETNPAFVDAATEAERIGPLLERAQGATWYEAGNDADAAVVALCRLRRAGAGASGHAGAGDAAVRDVLAGANPEDVVWVASRMVSYMDEHGFPELVSGERA
jgi:hypothetical protein